MTSSRKFDFNDTNNDEQKKFVVTANPITLFEMYESRTMSKCNENGCNNFLWL